MMQARLDDRRGWVLSVLDEYEARLTRFAARLLGDEDAARDVVQYAFLRLCDQSPGELRDRVAQWLFTVCRNRAVDVLRTRGRTTSLDHVDARATLATDEDPAVAVEREELARRLGALVAGLPTNQREAVDLWAEGLTEEIARLERRRDELRRELRKRARRRARAPGTEQYDRIVENDFLPAASRPLSTFSIDVDTASYANVRRFLNEGRWPPPGAVRIEEMVNYFRYDYAPPNDGAPFSVHMEVAQCPWQGEHRLLRIGLKGREVEREKRGPSNLVFLLDVSGSMRDRNKLPLLRQAMRLLVEQLTEDDRVAIVTYASDAGLQLESTCATDRRTILDAIDSLSAGGSTHGSAGIQLAYEQAGQHFVEGGANRVIVATDGDLNVGVTDNDELVKLIRKKARGGVFLTVLGFGTGNLKDAKLEKLADHGNGMYAYVDNLREARKVLIEQVAGSLVTIAKDVKCRSSSIRPR